MSPAFTIVSAGHAVIMHDRDSKAPSEMCLGFYEIHLSLKLRRDRIDRIITK